ncbi:MAG: hypothetical protein LDL44_12555 [Caenispirillum sp.]|nr:hypothetical protein [Caenispirillum sp.]
MSAAEQLRAMAEEVGMENLRDLAECMTIQSLDGAAATADRLATLAAAMLREAGAQAAEAERALTAGPAVNVDCDRAAAAAEEATALAVLALACCLQLGAQAAPSPEGGV